MRLSNAAVVVAVVATAGCATIQEVLALRNVDFSLDRVSDVRLVGIELGRVTSFGDLSLAQTGQLLSAVADRDLRLDLDVHLTALNPSDNSVDARLVSLDWMLLLEERETVTGTFARETLLPRGQPTDVPISVSLNLIDFFEGSAQDLVELALSIAGQGGDAKEVTLRATPTIETALGPIRYPEPITIVRRDVGA